MRPPLLSSLSGKHNRPEDRRVSPTCLCAYRFFQKTDQNEANEIEPLKITVGTCNLLYAKAV
ncbi:hypothetical protein A2U01_0010550 [Trifolium medium]|uniref:Uncharacterized protein n=1 Tax=Trifolium medium TaxID=97028 RepID=A0A392MQ68_9FABA|nr:hypothetical protein [Trifolium medium]